MSTITSALCKKWVNNRLRDTNWLNTSCLISFVLLLKSKQTQKAGRSERWPTIAAKCSPQIRLGAPILLAPREREVSNKTHRLDDTFGPQKAFTQLFWKHCKDSQEAQLEFTF